jgi:hypothetical protein
VSHHFDSPTAIEDGRINLCDVFVFPGPSNTTTLVLTVNPDSGRSTPTTFRPDALYEFVIAGDGGNIEDRAFRLTFDEPDATGRQQMRIRYATGEQSRSGTEGTELGAGHTGDTIALNNGGSAWFGPAGDPFWADGVTLFAFHAALAEGQYKPELFDAGSGNLFAGRNVTAIALQVPDAAIGDGQVAVWARISLYGHAPQRQVSRMGNPMLRPLFFFQPGPETEALNAGSPADDLARFGDAVRGSAAHLAKLRHLEDPEAHAATLAAAFLPDVLRYRPGRESHFNPGTGNGRSLECDAFGIALSLFAGEPLAETESPYPNNPAFPYLQPTGNDELPALADLFGLREQAPQQTD